MYQVNHNSKSACFYNINYFCFISLNKWNGCNNVLRSNKHREQASHEDGEPGPGVHEDLLIEQGDSECPSRESGSDWESASRSLLWHITLHTINIIFKGSLISALILTHQRPLNWRHTHPHKKGPVMENYSRHLTSISIVIYQAEHDLWCPINVGWENFAQLQIFQVK